MALPQQESSDFESPKRGMQAYWPDEDIEGEQLVNLDASNPGSLPPGAYGEDELVEPLNPPRVGSSHHGDADDPGWPETRDDPDPFTLHAPYAALEQAKREWQEAREALIDDCVHQQFQLREEFDKERKVLYHQLQRDQEQQERMTGGSLTGEPDEGKGLVPDKDEEPCDPDSGDEEKDALIPDRHDPSSGAAHSTSNGDSVGSPYAWASSRQAGRGAKTTERRASTWLTQPIDQDIYSEWDPAAQHEWSQAQVRIGAWAPEPGAVAWRRERDEMQQEIHFLRRNMELLLARAEAAERDCQDPPLLPPQLPKGEWPVPAFPNDEPPGQPGPLGLPGPQQPQVQQRWWRVKACFEGTMAYFLVQVAGLLPRAG
uniref:Uncharacterized protein n=1 Tax=Sphaerodactylus townsendi TaxID=933632 RepID=A0ACB8FFY2_9SAUR